MIASMKYMNNKPDFREDNLSNIFQFETFLDYANKINYLSFTLLCQRLVKFINSNKNNFIITQIHGKYREG